MKPNFIHNFKKIKNYLNINNKANLIVATKNQDVEKINDLINEGHRDFGENKVQEAKLKWTNILKINPNVRLHFIGKLQSNKIKRIGELFEFIHSLDSIKNAELLAKEELRASKKLKYFIQVNLAREIQKSGVEEENLSELVIFCKKINLNVIGLMFMQPITGGSSFFFKRLKILSNYHSLNELSMGMSNDYEDAINCGSTWIRIGSSIFNKD
jgi:pyridoxal phosphate enzyme (YggS family)